MTKITKQEIQTLCLKLSVEDRRLLIVGLLTQQRKRYKGKGKDYNRDMCSLIDLQKGLIVGSGVCPKCSGWMGRAEYGDK